MNMLSFEIKCQRDLIKTSRKVVRCFTFLFYFCLIMLAFDSYQMYIAPTYIVAGGIGSFLFNLLFVMSELHMSKWDLKREKEYLTYLEKRLSEDRTDDMQKALESSRKMFNDLMEEKFHKRPSVEPAVPQKLNQAACQAVPLSNGL